MNPTVPALSAAIAVALLAWSTLRPAALGRAGELTGTRRTAGRRRPEVMARLGGTLRRVAARPPDPAADRRVGWVVTIAVLMAIVLPPLAALWIAGAGGASVMRRRRESLRDQRRLVDELPEVVDLLTLATSAGLTVPLAVAVVADRGTGRLAEELGRARRSAELGTGLADALDEVPRRLGDPVRPITRVLSGSLRDGTSIVPALERVAGEVRTQRRRAAEERARKVSVRLLLPLVCCVLPAFALLTVVPLLAGALSGIAL